MASNLSTLGFVFASEDEFRAAMVRHAAETIGQLACAPGVYGIWRSRSGAEIWFHLSPSSNGSTEIQGLTPFFEGTCDAKLRITAAIHRDGDNEFEGAFHAWVSPDESDGGSFPLVFEAVDFATQSEATWPAVRVVRIAAFARELRAFASEQAYAESQQGEASDKFRMAPQAFIPIGLFAAAMSSEDKKKREAPSTTALFSGTVLEHRALTNEATGHSFTRLLIETTEINLEVLADPEVISGNIVEGGIVEVTAALFGRFLN